MIRSSSYLPVLALMAMVPGAHALESGVGQFEKLVPGAEKAVVATKASLSDRVTYRFFLATTPGEHPLRVVIYDGSGREAFRALSTLAVKPGPAGRTISYGFDKTRDAPGTWWYVVHLDDRIVLSDSIEVVP